MNWEQLQYKTADLVDDYEELCQVLEQNLSVWRKRHIDGYELYCECFITGTTRLTSTDEGTNHNNRFRLLELIREAQNVFALEDCGYLSYWKYLLNRQEKFCLYDLNECRKDIMLLKTYGAKYDDVVTMDVLDQVNVDFSLIDNKFAEHFLELPYNYRKVLMPVNQYRCIPMERIQILDMQQLSNFDFPMGHPIANELYMGHPLIPHKYIPFENYQLELVEDKIHEFCEIAQSLGALEITIECHNNNVTDHTDNSNQKMEIDGSYKVVKCNGTYNSECSRHLIDELSKSIKLHQTFCPSGILPLPENLVWYKNEPSWQSLVKQRMSGTLSSYEEHIETKKCQMVENHEMREIKGEISSLYASMNLNWDKSDETKYQVQENAVLSIKVQFATISQFGNDTAPIQSQQLTQQEQEYIVEVKECLTDGEIGASERRLLNKLRDKLGVSEERAAELERSLAQPQFTEKEKEYLEAYHDAMEDGVVSAIERRLLDKLMKVNGISEERAKELEKL